MIYRILTDSVTYDVDPVTQTFRDMPSATRMRGAFMAGVGEGFGDLPAPRLNNRRARFYFTELGWRCYGRHVYAAARRRGHVIRVIRRKNPDQSQVAYRDAYQLAVLPRIND